MSHFLRPGFLLILGVFTAAVSCASGPASPAAAGTVPSILASGSVPDLPVPPLDGSPIVFPEIWAYLMSGEESFFNPGYPLSDIGYFGAGINSYGELCGVPDPGILKGYTGRVHLVIAEVGNLALTHFCIDPAYPVRDRLIADIASAARPFDGVQIDFEAIPKKDYDLFFSFLTLLKKAIGSKTLSVALPAIANEKVDRFGYERVAAIADRVIIMAYDEHWSTSEPGSVASMDWCRKVSAYAVLKIPAGKLVMGLPFYGRSWTDRNLSRAYKHSSVLGLIEENHLGPVSRENGVPWLEFDQSVKVRLYFEDAVSNLTRLELYRTAGVHNVAFWRLGQEDRAIWRSLSLGPVDAPQAAVPKTAAVPAVEETSQGRPQ